MRYTLCLLIVASCGNWALAKEDYLPLAVGNHWTMAVKAVSSKGQIITGTYQEETTGTVKKNGRDYFQMQHWVDWKSPDAKTARTKVVKHAALVRKTEKAYYSTVQTKAGFEEGVIYVLPLKTGTSWHVRLASKQRKITVLGRGTVKVPAGTYRHCYHLRVVYRTGTIKNIWLAPAIGKVKVNGTYPDGHQTTFLLTDFKPGK